MKEKLFHIGIKAVIVNGNKALVLKDNTRYSGYDVPGGKINEGETIEQALERELEEELGPGIFKMGEILHAHEREDYDKDGIRLMLIFYKVDAEITEIKLSDEHTSFKWVGKSELDSPLFRNDGVKTALLKALE